MNYELTLQTYQSLQSGDRVEVVHDVKVGFRSWTSRTVGTVVDKERRRHSLHFNRQHDDKVYSDVLVLRRADGELTTVTLDEYTHLTRLAPASEAAAP